MCHRCDYVVLLKNCGLDPTPSRLRVLEVVGNNNSPLSAQEIYDTLRRNRLINRVTVYRILDLLVDSGLVDRLSGAGRSFVYGLAPNENHPAHPHFYCRQCGHLECLHPQSLMLDLDPMHRSFPGLIENVEVRVDGICKNCMRRSKRSQN